MVWYCKLYERRQNKRTLIRDKELLLRETRAVRDQRVAPHNIARQRRARASATNERDELVDTDPPLIQIQSRKRRQDYVVDSSMFTVYFLTTRQKKTTIGDSPAMRNDVPIGWISDANHGCLHEQWPSTDECPPKASCHV